MRTLLHITHATTSQDAVELCGAANEITLAQLDAPCPGAVSSSPALGVITTARGQNISGKTYALPAYRLYICHPGAGTRGFLYSQEGFRKIKTADEMRSVVDKLFANRLWEHQAPIWEYAIRAWCYVCDFFRGREALLSPTMLWVLDQSGNFIFAPEVQGSHRHKHGDLTPGRLPWTRASAGTLPKHSWSCCCEPAEQGRGCEHPTAILSTDGKRCCRAVLNQTCGDLLEATSSTCGIDPEQRQSGSYRGVARSGGELRFPAGDGPALMHDRSGYSIDRLALDSLHGFAATPDMLQNSTEMNFPQVVRALQNGQEAPKIGQCGMDMLKSYWQDSLQLPTLGASFVTVTDSSTIQEATFRQIFVITSSVVCFLLLLSWSILHCCGFSICGRKVPRRSVLLEGDSDGEPSPPDVDQQCLSGRWREGSSMTTSASSRA